jgi:hypothetical protein
MSLPGSACHSLVQPVSRPDVTLEALHASAVTRVWRLYSDDRRDGPRGRQLREAERRRPLAPGSDLRAVLITHLDGDELVLVAARDRLSHCCLAALGSAESTHDHPSPADHAAETGTGLARLVAAAAELCAAALGREAVPFLVEDDGYVRTGPEASDEPFLGILVTGAHPDAYLPVLGPLYPVTVVAYRAGDGSYRLDAQADPGVVDLETARVLEEWLPRCEAAGAAPFTLTRPEIEGVLRLGRGPALAGRLAATIPEAFAAIAAEHGGQVAVSGDGGDLTYAGLDEASAAAARGLIARGAEPGERIGVCVERTVVAVVALLAVLRAGCCYVPLDPTHPTARRAHVTRDARLRFVITDVDPGGLPAGVVTLSPADLTESDLPSVPLPQVAANDPAYVIYTSGTTGDPKGALIPHRNVLALLAATRSTVGLGPQDVWTAFHSFAFDFSVWEIWG